MNSESSFLLAQIKKDFFKFRNGVVADALKKIYPEGKIIYGLTVPQFQELSRIYSKDLNLGLTLWEDKKNRESRLMSLYILPPQELTKEVAIMMINDVESIEEGDFLAFKILRYLPFAKELYQEMKERDISNSMVNHCLEMFRRNINL